MKKIIFLILFALLWVPFLQEVSHVFNESQLKGAYIKPDKPAYALDSVMEMKFQGKFETYHNFNFGFHSWFVKLKNTVNYLLFGELSVPDNIAGKDGYIYSVVHIERTLGLLYNGKEQNNKTVERINFLKEGLEKKGKQLIVLMVPSKETVMPEFLPRKYVGINRSNTDYLDLLEGFNDNKINYLDYCAYFKKIVKTSEYPLFTKTGVHWSVFGASVAQDTLVGYIEKLYGSPLARCRRTGVELSDTARGSDNDFEAPLNLFMRLGKEKYAYPTMEIIPETIGRKRPKIIIVGDSFFWQIKGYRMLMNIFSEDSKFLYYFNTSCPIGDAAGCPISDIDVMKEIENADVIVLEGSIGTLDRFPYGITDYYFQHMDKPDFLENICRILMADNARMKALRKERGSAATVSNEELALDEARKSIKEKTQVGIVASNNKYLCAGGDEDLLPTARADKASLWETFNIIPLGNGKVIIYSYKNKFLSVDAGGGCEVLCNTKVAGYWEMFEMNKLTDGSVTFKADNGKYLSLDINTGKLKAISSNADKNEKFKLEKVE